MHIAACGQGPALVLVHGWAMHSGIFAPLARALCEHFTLYLVDLPGHGASPQRNGPLQLDACARRIAAAVPPAPWLGWSLGGLVALHAAALGEAVRGLVMLCAPPRFVRAADWPHAVEPEVFAGFAAALERDVPGTLQRFVALQCHGAVHGRDELRLLRGALFARGRPSPAALADGLQALARTDLRAALPALAVPSLWIAGGRDRLVDWRAQHAAAALAPRGRFLCLDGAGHAPFLGDPHALAAAVTAFAAGCTA